MKEISVNEQLFKLHIYENRMLVKSIFANTGCAFAGLLLLEKPYQ